MIATKIDSVSARLALTMLEWLDGAGHLGRDTDLCLVRLVPGLDDAPLPSEVVMSGQRRWRLAAVEGDFALRVALVDARDTPLIAFTSLSEESFQADLRERSVLRRVIRPLARHVFAALVGRDASALDDDRFAWPLTRLLESGSRELLLDAARRRTWGSAIRESDAAALICAAAFGFDDRYVERAPGELWQRWLCDPPLVDEALLALADETLRRRYPLYLKVLAAPAHDPRVAFVLAARHDTLADPDVRQLARDAARRLLADDRGVLDELLRPAEEAYIAAGSPETEAPMLSAAYAARVRRLVQRCGTTDPPATSEISSLESFVYEKRSEREALLRLSRLCRGMLAIEARPLPTTLAEYAIAWRDDLAWLDRSARRLRESHVEGTEAAAAIRGLLERWYALRDRWNAAFAKRLAFEWPTLFGAPGTTAPLVVSQILKHVVRPDLKRTPTFLIVLDGCDIPTFLEIAEAFDAIGIAPAGVDLALSAIPTMTSHARRAIFGGAIPRDGIRDDDRAADANGDRGAFEGANEYLGTTVRKLFLKGDLGDGGEALVRVLEHPDTAPRLVAAVFNDVDDAIASKEHGVLAERTIDRCTPAFRSALSAAFEANWRIVITADHGHTPYRDPDVKASLANARYVELAPGAAAPADTVLFENRMNGAAITGLPYRIAALYRLGQHSGPQHVGYHGGVSLEEMFVPLAIYGPKETRGSALVAPPWWNDDVRVLIERVATRKPAPLTPPSVTAVTRVDAPSPSIVPAAVSVGAILPSVQTSNGLGGTVRSRSRAALANDAKLLAIFDRIAEAGMLDAAQLARAVELPAGRIRVNVTGLCAKLEAAGIEPPIAIEDEPLVVRWIGPR